MFCLNPDLQIHRIAIEGGSHLRSNKDIIIKGPDPETIAVLHPLAEMGISLMPIIGNMIE
jgi:hypothetical protein